MRRVYSIGDCVLDLFFEDDKPVEAKPGGSFLNSSVSLGRLGVHVSLVSELGTDRVGDLIMSFLQNNEVDIRTISRFSDVNSNLALAFLDEDKNADYSFYKTRKGMDSVLAFPDNVKKDDIVLFGSFLAIKKELRNNLLVFLKKARKNGALLIYDPNFRLQHLPLLDEVLPFICENMALAHLVKASNEDFELICGTKNSKESFGWLKKYSHAMLIYTANKNGVFVHGTKDFSFSTPPLKPISTVGAGDTFNAAIAYFFIRNCIVAEDVKSLSDADIQNLIELAILFSQEVCMSYDNFVSNELASHYRL